MVVKLIELCGIMGSRSETIRLHMYGHTAIPTVHGARFFGAGWPSAGGKVVPHPRHMGDLPNG